MTASINATKRLKPLPSKGKEARRRYRISHCLRKLKYRVDGRSRMVFGASLPESDSTAHKYVAELRQCGFEFQYTID